MVEAELHFFQVEIEVVAADTVITLELGLCIAPEVFDAIDVPTLAHSKALLMIDTVVLEAVEHQPIVGAEAVGVDDALRYDLRLDDLPQSLARNIFDDAGVDTPFALQEPENRDLPGCNATARPFATATEVALIAFDLAAEWTLQFTFTS